MILQRVRSVLSDLLESVFELFVGERIALAEHLREVPQYLFDRLDIARVAVNEQFVSPRADIHIEQRFEILDVLVVDAEQRIKALGW